MCKRFSFKTTGEVLESQFAIENGYNLKWSYNIAPTQHAYVILSDAPDRLQYISWGLIPANSRDGKNEGRLANARKEGIGVSSSFRLPIRSRRCLIPADSFYSWKKEGLKEIPFRVTIEDHSIMLLAGVWDLWESGDYGVKSFSIITKPTTGDLKEICPRMPVIIHNPEDRSDWLKNIPLQKVQSIMDQKDPDVYHFYKISDDIQSISRNDPGLHEMIAQ